jgi:uncharacterized repeat protein (TIGR04138 family)
MQIAKFDEALAAILKKDHRYERDAYLFVKDALDHTQKLKGKPAKSEQPRHVSPQELLEGIRVYGLNQYGPMVSTVLEAWGVRSSADFGEIVFNMVEHALLSKTENDSREDFQHGYDFQTAFREPFLPAVRRASAPPQARPAKA